MAGDRDSLVVLNEAVVESPNAGKTQFVVIDPLNAKNEATYAAVTPGRQIVLFGTNIRSLYDKEKREHYTVLVGFKSRYAMGDTAVYGSYNLSYMGSIVSITTKRIGVKPNASDRKKLMTLDSFAFYNWSPDTIEKASKSNREWMD